MASVIETVNFAFAPQECFSHAAQAEYNSNANFSIFGLDLYNYGNSNAGAQIHFYNAGFAYKKNAARFQVAMAGKEAGLFV